MHSSIALHIAANLLASPLRSINVTCSIGAREHRHGAAPRLPKPTQGLMLACGYTARQVYSHRQYAALPACRWTRY